MEILIAVLILGGVALLLGLMLSYASKVFAVPQDEKEIAIREALPGANCGACGYAGCDGYAEALNKGEAEPNLCAPGGSETAKALGEILGVEVSITPKKAVVKCKGCLDNAQFRYDYSGLTSCASAMTIAGGPKDCSFGCLGLGDCMRACDFNAITIKNGLPQINLDICGGCGGCASACPKGIISIMEFPFKPTVLCKSKDKGAISRKVCKASCIGCGICAKNCEAGAITVTDFLAEIDPQKCTGCGACISKCPQKCIE